MPRQNEIDSSNVVSELKALDLANKLTIQSAYASAKKNKQQALSKA